MQTRRSNDRLISYHNFWKTTQNMRTLNGRSGWLSLSLDDVIWRQSTLYDLNIVLFEERHSRAVLFAYETAVQSIRCTTFDSRQSAEVGCFLHFIIFTRSAYMHCYRPVCGWASLLQSLDIAPPPWMSVISVLWGIRRCIDSDRCSRNYGSYDVLCGVHGSSICIQQGEGQGGFDSRLNRLTWV